MFYLNRSAVRAIQVFGICISISIHLSWKCFVRMLILSSIILWKYVFCTTVNMLIIIWLWQGFIARLERIIYSQNWFWLEAEVVLSREGTRCSTHWRSIKSCTGWFYFIPRTVWLPSSDLKQGPSYQEKWPNVQDILSYQEKELDIQHFEVQSIPETTLSTSIGSP